jgi:serine/threonine protein kinase
MEDNIQAAIVANGYDVCEMIGQGGFSECYKVFSLLYKQYFVCKVISLEGKEVGVISKIFENEIATLSRITHPHIIRIYKSFSSETHLFLILEYCSNGDMHMMVTKNGPIVNKFELLILLSRILEALVYLENNNIAHKDIKPANIFIDKHGRPKLADFGFSSFYKDGELSNDHIGSLAFLAPEVISKKPYNPLKADIWSFGVTVYFIVTGKFPFEARDKKSLIKAMLTSSCTLPQGLPQSVINIIVGSLVFNPDDRITFSQMKSIVDKELSETNVFLPVKKRSSLISMIPRMRHNIIKRPKVLSATIKYPVLVTE